MSTPPAGWYADPAGSTQYRWWDGRTWTDALSPVAQARPPSGANPVDESAGASASDRAAGSVGAAGSVAEIDTLEIGHHRRLSPTPVVLLVVLAVIAVGVGTAVFRPASDTPGLSSGGAGSGVTPSASSTPAPAPPLSTAPHGSTGSVPPGWVNVASGDTRIGDATMTLPVDPYVVSDQPARPAEMFDAGFAANALVHAGQPDAPAWLSTVALLHVPADQVQGNGSATARRAGTAVLSYLFADIEIDPKRVAFADDTVSGRPATRVTAEIWYDVDGLPSTHDDITLRIVELPDGSYAAAVASVPDDATNQLRDLAAAALGTFSVR